MLVDVALVSKNKLFEVSPFTFVHGASIISRLSHMLVISSPHQDVSVILLMDLVCKGQT